MGLQPIFKRLNCFQLEQNRKRHRNVDADAWCKRALNWIYLIYNYIKENSHTFFLSLH